MMLCKSSFLLGPPLPKRLSGRGPVDGVAGLLNGLLKAGLLLLNGAAIALFLLLFSYSKI